VSLVKPEKLDIVEKPEIFIGLVAAVGTPLDFVCKILEEEFEKRDYKVEEIRLSDFLKENLMLETQFPSEPKTEFDRIKNLMDRGNELRKNSDAPEILALIAAAQINEKRPSDDQKFLSGNSFVFRQLKHPDEILWLRKIYGKAFHLIGIYCPEDIRKINLTNQRLDKHQVEELITRDEGEDSFYGQQLRRSFYLSDIFIEIKSLEDQDHIKKQIERYFKLLFAEEIITPSFDEYGMYLAYASSLRSADLARQVGAAILDNNREVISLGTNDVPSPKGGQYWEDSEKDQRDFKKGFDSNTKKKLEIIEEIINAIEEPLSKNSERNKEEMMNRLYSTQIMHLTEFGRAVHAEMEAILSAGRIGVSTRGCHLYTTTFPCHNCAKHIVSAGIKTVKYIEPYPKSLAPELHDDSIAFLENGQKNKKTSF